MPVTEYLDGDSFDPETTRVLGVALEMVCIALRTGDSDDGVKQAIATKLIALAKAGERNPDILCEEALKDIRKPQEWAASEAARSFVLQSGQKTQNWDSTLMRWRARELACQTSSGRRRGDGDLSAARGETAVLKYFQERLPYGLFLPDVP
jgi:hypothetical protein